MKNAKHQLVMDFDNEDALKHFALWLCEAGEQDYWEWMKARELEQGGHITAVQFHYHEGGSFIANNKITAECGRLDSEDGQ